MKQVLAILRKDMLRLRLQLAGALALTVLIGYVDRPDSSSFASNLAYILWIACWVYIGASLIHQEHLPGDRQYWLTRPYDWRRLLAAKVLFGIVFAVLPLIAIKMAVLWVNGIPPLRHAPAILSNSLAFMGAVGLFAGSLAAVTATLTQFLWGLLAISALGGVAIALGVDYGGDWGAISWIRSATVYLSLAAAGALVLLLQYRLRRTFASRVILSLAALIAAVAPFGNAWHDAWRLSSSAPESLPVRLSFDSTPRARMQYADAPMVVAPGYRGIYLPVRVSGIPSGSAMVSQRVEVTLAGSSGTLWTSGWRREGAVIGMDRLADVRFIRADGPAWQYLDIDRAIYETIKDVPVQINVSIALLLLSDRRTGSMPGFGRTKRLPLDGICDARPVPEFSRSIRAARDVRNAEMSCAWPKPGPERAYMRVTSPPGVEDSHALLTTHSDGVLSIDQPVWRRVRAVLAFRGAEPRFTLETWRASERLDRSFQISGVRLRDYAAPRATDPQ